MYDKAQGLNFYCSTPISKKRNDRVSECDEFSTKKEIRKLELKISKLTEKLSETVVKKKRLESSLVQRNDKSKSRNDIENHRSSSFSKFSTDYSSIQKPRNLALSQINFTDDFENSFVKSSNTPNHIDYEEMFKKSLVKDALFHQQDNSSDQIESSIFELDDKQKMSQILSRLDENVSEKPILIDNTFNREYLANIKFHKSCSSSSKLSPLSSVKSHDLRSNDDKTPCDEDAQENSRSSSIGFQEKVEIWLNKFRDFELTNETELAVKPVKLRDMSTNASGIYDMEARVSRKGLQKKNLVDDDEGFDSDDRQKRANVVIYNGINRKSRKEIILENFNKTKYQIIENEHEISFEKDSQSESSNLGTKRKLSNSHKGESLQSPNQNLTEVSELSCDDNNQSEHEQISWADQSVYGKVSDLIKENEILRQIMANYESCPLNSRGRYSKLERKLERSKRKMNDLIDLVNTTLNRCDIEMKLSAESNNRLRDTIVNQTAIMGDIYNRYHTLQARVR